MQQCTFPSLGRIRVCPCPGGSFDFDATQWICSPEAVCHALPPERNPLILPTLPADTKRGRVSVVQATASIALVAPSSFGASAWDRVYLWCPVLLERLCRGP